MTQGMLLPRMSVPEPPLFLGDAKVGALEQFDSGSRNHLRPPAAALLPLPGSVLAVRSRLAARSVPNEGLDRRNGDLARVIRRAPAGWMQWKDPPPVRIARDARPITSRPKREQVFQSLNSECAGTLLVDGHDHRAVGDEEIHMAGGSGLATVAFDPTGRGNAYDLKPTASGVSCTRQTARCVVIGLGVRIAPTKGDWTGNDTWGDETRQVVHVTVSVVVDQALAQPKHGHRTHRFSETPPQLQLQSSLDCGWDSGRTGLSSAPSLRHRDRPPHPPG